MGFDANWEGNLDRARKSRGNENYSFRECSAADEFVLTRDFDIAICLETLEHLPTAHLGTYLERLAKATRHYLFASVPNEKGLLFAAKWLAKRTSGTYYEGYSAREFLYATFGQVRRIPRYAETGNGHKGFDWQAVVEQVSRYFDVESVTGLPFLAMPKSFGFTIGIVAKARRASIRSQAKSGLPAANFAASRVV